MHNIQVLTDAKNDASRPADTRKQITELLKTLQSKSIKKDWAITKHCDDQFSAGLQTFVQNVCFMSLSVHFFALDHIDCIPCY